MPTPVSSGVPEEFALLVASLATITDFHLARGKVHPLPGVLALVRDLLPRRYALLQRRYVLSPGHARSVLGRAVSRD